MPRPKSEGRSGDESSAEERSETRENDIRTDVYDMGRKVDYDKMNSAWERSGSLDPDFTEVNYEDSVNQEPGNKVRSSMKRPGGAKGGYKKRPTGY